MGVAHNYDFSGWASKNDLQCRDGRIIRSGAFKVQDGEVVPLVYMHSHKDIGQLLGKVLLENRPEGVYAYGYLNDSPQGKHAKEALKHGDVTGMSIWANDVVQDGPNVTAGTIREVSLVLAGANPGAFVESVASHGIAMDDYDGEGIFYTGDSIIVEHADAAPAKEPETKKKDDKADQEGDGKEETIGDVVSSMSEKQKNVMYALIADAVANATDSKEQKEEDNDNKKGDAEMKHNAFSDGTTDTTVLSHSDEMKIINDAKKLGSLRDAIKQNIENGVLCHAVPMEGMTGPSGSTAEQTYGFRDPDMLFPEPKALNTTPEWLSREMSWVSKVMNGVHRTPFSRIKSMYANITEDDARAKGYMKGNKKKEEVFTLLKRSTTPQTVYKLQRLDRDDIIDITDFDVVAWIRNEMRMMLDEELARAILIGDGRETSSDDHISEDHIRPIVKDVDLYNTTILVEVEANATPEQIAEAEIDAIIRARKDYKGTGNPTFWTTEDTVTEMLMIKDQLKRRLYNTEVELATVLRVGGITTVEPMENHQVEYKSTKYPLIGVMVNLADYNVGVDTGGAVANFDDFDIQFNQYRYLIETRCSGALIKPFSAVTFLLKKK